MFVNGPSKGGALKKTQTFPPSSSKQMQAMALLNLRGQVEDVFDIRPKSPPHRSTARDYFSSPTHARLSSEPPPPRHDLRDDFPLSFRVHLSDEELGDFAAVSSAPQPPTSCGCLPCDSQRCRSTSYFICCFLWNYVVSLGPYVLCGLDVVLCTLIYLLTGRDAIVTRRPPLAFRWVSIRDNVEDIVALSMLRALILVTVYSMEGCLLGHRSLYTTYERITYAVSTLSFVYVVTKAALFHYKGAMLNPLSVTTSKGWPLGLFIVSACTALLLALNARQVRRKALREFLLGLRAPAGGSGQLLAYDYRERTQSDVPHVVVVRPRPSSIEATARLLPPSQQASNAVSLSSLADDGVDPQRPVRINYASAALQPTMSLPPPAPHHAHSTASTREPRPLFTPPRTPPTRRQTSKPHSYGGGGPGLLQLPTDSDLTRPDVEVDMPLLSLQDAASSTATQNKGRHVRRRTTTSLTGLDLQLPAPLTPLSPLLPDVGLFASTEQRISLSQPQPGTSYSPSPPPGGAEAAGVVIEGAQSVHVNGPWGIDRIPDSLRVRVHVMDTTGSDTVDNENESTAATATVVFVHGVGSGGFRFRSLLPSLAKSLPAGTRLIAYDRPYHGDSWPTDSNAKPRSLTAETHATLLITLCKHMHVRGRIALVGDRDGALIALATASLMMPRRGIRGSPSASPCSPSPGSPLTRRLHELLMSTRSRTPTPQPQPLQPLADDDDDCVDPTDTVHLLSPTPQFEGQRSRSSSSAPLRMSTPSAPTSPALTMTALPPVDASDLQLFAVGLVSPCMGGGDSEGGGKDLRKLAGSTGRGATTITALGRSLLRPRIRSELLDVSICKGRYASGPPPSSLLLPYTAHAARLESQGRLELCGRFGPLKESKESADGDPALIKSAVTQLAAFHVPITCVLGEGDLAGNVLANQVMNLAAARSKDPSGAATCVVDGAGKHVVEESVDAVSEILHELLLANLK